MTGRRFQILALLLLSLGLRAHADIVTDCNLSGRIELQDSRLYSCANGLAVAPGTEIVTNGKALAFNVEGKIELPSKAEGGLAIDCNSGSCLVEASGNTPSGYLAVNDEGAELTGAVALEFTSTNDYDQDLHLGPATGVNLVLNGEMVVPEGDSLKFPDSAVY